MQAVGTVVQRELVFLSLQGETPLGDAVRKTADKGAHGGLTVFDLLDGLVALHHICQLAMAIRHQHLFNARAVVRDAHLHPVSIADGVKVDRLAIDLGAELLRLQRDIGCDLARGRGAHDGHPRCGCDCNRPGHTPKLLRHGSSSEATSVGPTAVFLIETSDAMLPVEPDVRLYQSHHGCWSALT